MMAVEQLCMSNGKDISLSRRQWGFDFPWGYLPQKEVNRGLPINLKFILPRLMSKRLMGILIQN